MGQTTATEYEKVYENETSLFDKSKKSKTPSHYFNTLDPKPSKK